MSYSALLNLVCSRCQKKAASGVIQQTCPDCDAPYLCEYDLERVRASWEKHPLVEREKTLWRYHELLPLQSEENRVSLYEPMTGVWPLLGYAKKIGLRHLYVKDEGILPTGSFKARGASVGLSRARELGVRAFAMPTNGNAGSAWAAYAARAQIPALIVLPSDAPRTPRKEMIAYGADVYVVDGTIGDAGRLTQALCKATGVYDVSTLREPYRLEGKKTMGLEIAEQFAGGLPDVIVYPTGGGAGVIGIHRALAQLQAMGRVQGPLPKMVIVQAEGCAPLVRAFEQGEDVSVPVNHPFTSAFGMRVPKALGDFMILKTLRETGGTAIRVSERQIADTRRQLAQDDGFFVCPEGAAAFAGVDVLRASGWLKEKDRVLVVNTGSGLKYTDDAPFDVPQASDVGDFSRFIERVSMRG
ncbi:threonine synthase [Ferroacidibacillus organovorans]|uniref:Threonine synthase n=1 Tax=Ferroacidibacillus organovorans TaxID=1765683 RepID=A0A1V4EXD4_9BACL|nr:threonine synthase [Ferroacidibacillus organovorans]OPG17308.1 threonine synthase [Ferroacidibacillus organovorans]